MYFKLVVILAVLTVVSFGVTQDEAFDTSYAQSLAAVLAVEMDVVVIDCPQNDNTDVYACIELPGTASMARTLLSGQLSEYDDVTQIGAWEQMDGRNGYTATYTFGEPDDLQGINMLVGNTGDLTFAVIQHFGYIGENGFIENPSIE